LPRTYALKRLGSLLLTRAAVTGPGGTKAIKLLVDTGSSFTIVPLEVLESIGLSPAESQHHQRILTLTGYIVAPKVQILSLNTCGKTFREPVVIGHTLPFGNININIIDGLLGMDFLLWLDANIAVARGRIEVTWQ
jgi:predicted aspartyl protease